MFALECPKCRAEGLVNKTAQGLIISQCILCGYRTEEGVATSNYFREGYIDRTYHSDDILTDIRWLLTFEEED